MSKTNNSHLTFPPMPDSGFDHISTPVALDPRYAPVIDHRHFVDESPRQLAAMEIKKRKTMAAINQISEIDRHAQSTFSETVANLMASKQQVKDTDSQAYVEEFSQHLAQVLAQQILAVTKIGAVAIAEEVASTPFFTIEMKEKSEPKGFWARLLGG